VFAKKDVQSYSGILSKKLLKLVFIYIRMLIRKTRNKVWREWNKPVEQN
jgi:hypothetical protein